MPHDSPYDLMIVWVVCFISLLALVHNFIAVAWPRLPCGMGFLTAVFFKLLSIGSACLFCSPFLLIPTILAHGLPVGKRLFCYGFITIAQMLL